MWRAARKTSATGSVMRFQLCFFPSVGDLAPRDVVAAAIRAVEPTLLSLDGTRCGGVNERRGQWHGGAGDTVVGEVVGVWVQ